MHYPTLKDLPLPPESKTGWPWTEESLQLPDKMPDGRPWPKISIVTPNYNYGQFIEETIRSILLQGYPNLEYIIIDGGSTDASTDIIRRYEKWLTYWVSESDRGQPHAINKGFRKATGEIIAWLNSDDIYLPRTFWRAAQELDNSKGRHIVFGDCYLTDEHSKITGGWKGRFSNRRDLIKWWDCWRPSGPCWLIQPTIFFLKRTIDEAGLLDERLWMAFDYDLWLRMSVKHKFHYLEQILATYRLHPSSKSVTRNIPKWLAECEEVSRKYWGRKRSLSYCYYSFSLCLNKFRENAKKWFERKKFSINRIMNRYRTINRIIFFYRMALGFFFWNFWIPIKLQAQRSHCASIANDLLKRCDSASICSSLKECCRIDIQKVSISKEAFNSYLKNSSYTKGYLSSVYADSFIEKALEHYLSLEILNLSMEDTLIDIASDISPFIEIAKSKYRCRVYRQDLYYPKGIHGNIIGSRASQIPLPDDSVTKMTLHCSFEHFEGNEDIDFIREAGRLLMPAGEAIILPLYISSQPIILTSPKYAYRYRTINFDKRVPIMYVKGLGLPFVRFYDQSSFYERIIRAASKHGLSTKVLFFDNVAEIDPRCYVNFALLMKKRIQ